MVAMWWLRRVWGLERVEAAAPHSSDLRDSYEYIQKQVLGDQSFPMPGYFIRTDRTASSIAIVSYVMVLLSPLYLETIVYTRMSLKSELCPLYRRTVAQLVRVEFWSFLFPKLHYFQQGWVLKMISQINLDPDLFANKGKRLTARCWRPLAGDHTMECFR